MEQNEIRELLAGVAGGSVSIDEAMLKIKAAPFEDMGFAKPDYHRAVRQGMAEVIYGAGKTPEQIVKIAQAMLVQGQKTVLVTRMSAEAASYAGKKLHESSGFEMKRAESDGSWLDSISGEKLFVYDELSRTGIIGEMPAGQRIGKIVIATGGTSDIPVAEEAAKTAEVFGNNVVRLYDVGVAGIHRLFSQMDEIMTASVIIAIAGMEGALASVIGGMADCPVIAVPTSVGYGASFNGLAALLSMLNSCASGVSVVNIDNGFGAGYLASMINHIGI